MVWCRSERKMSSTNITFKRDAFITDLFNPQTTIQKFDVVEFTGIPAFMKAVTLKLFNINDLTHTKIWVWSLDDWKIIKRLFIETKIYFKQYIDICIPQEILEDIVCDFDEKIINAKFRLYVKFTSFIELNDLVNLSESFKKWVSGNRIYFILNLSKDNYIEQINMMGKLYITGLLRFFKVNFDYDSFQTCTLNDLHKIEFWINTLASFYKVDAEDKFTLDISGFFYRGVIVSEDLKLYYPNSNKLLFDLAKNLDKNGETLCSEELYNLRRYLDMKEKNVLFNVPVKKPAWELINWADNFKINNELVEVPPITCLILNWLGNIISTENREKVD